MDSCSTNNNTIIGNEFYEIVNEEKESMIISSRPSSSQDETQPLFSSTPSKFQRLATNRTVVNYSIDSDNRNSNNMPNLKSEQKKHVCNNETRGNEIDSFQAFLTLILIFLINSTTLASLKVYGIIFERIVAEGYYTGQQASWPISTASTVQNLAGFLTPMLALRLSWRNIEMIQAFMFVTANVGAYFSKSLAMDMICLSLIQGIACSIRYNMNVVINNEYFQKYRATAMGISLAGSSCGVIFLKPIVEYVLDSSGQHNFRNAYLVLAIIMSSNIIFGYFIRKPRNNHTNCTQNTAINSNGDVSIIRQESNNLIIDANPLPHELITLLKNPCIHFIWIMQTIYFYISRTYTIFIIDYGVVKGFELTYSRSLLSFWIYGEIGGRLLLGGFVDSKLLNLKWNIIIVNLVLALSGFALLLDPSMFVNKEQQVLSQNLTIITGSTLGQYVPDHTNNLTFFWISGFAIAMTAAMSSLLNIMIVPFGQEYLGKKNVPWAFALSSIVTGLLLLLRPVLIGISRDKQKSYDLLIIVLSSAPCIYGIFFFLVEPFLNYYRRTHTVIDRYV